MASIMAIIEVSIFQDDYFLPTRVDMLFLGRSGLPDLQTIPVRR